MQKTGNSSVSPAPDGSCKGIPDPLASYLATNPVTVAGCDHHFYSASGNQSITLNPGVYCGGMTFSGPVNVTLSPGLYVIKDGTLSETGGTFTGTGVTLFLTGLNAGIQMSGQASWHLSAPVAGAAGMPGFVIFLNSSSQVSTSSQLSGQAGLYFEGVVYLPGQQVSVTGNGDEISTSPYTSYIADTLRFTGNAELVINNDTTKTAVPIPQALMVQANGTLALTQ